MLQSMGSQRVRTTERVNNNYISYCISNNIKCDWINRCSKKTRGCQMRGKTQLYTVCSRYTVDPEACCCSVAQSHPTL